MSRAEAYAAYLDADGKPQLRTSCVLFFDLLGIRDMATSEDAVAYLRELRPALEAAIDRAMTEDERFTQASTWFTDNAVVGAPVLQDMFIESIVGGTEVAAAYLLLVCSGRGFLGRGSITLGAHYMDEKLVFGPALIEAAKLEKSARWPRVVLSDAAINSELRQSRSYAHPLQIAQNACSPARRRRNCLRRPSRHLPRRGRRRGGSQTLSPTVQDRHDQRPHVA